MAHKTHIKRTISIHLVNFQQKYLRDWFQMSQLCSFFRNFFFDSQHVDLAPRANSREVAALLPLDQEAGVLGDNLHRACTWFFRSKARLEPAKSCKDVLNSRKIDTKNVWALLLSLLLHALTSPDRIGNDLGRGLCAWCSNAGCQWIIENSLNF